MEKKLFEFLKELNIGYVEHEHPAVFTVAESEKIKQKIPGMHTKSLFLKGESGNFYLVCMNAHKRLNMPFLRKHLKEPKLHFASAEELKYHLSLTPGSVSIFGLIHSSVVHLILDKELLEADYVGFHPNLNTSTLQISVSDLKKIYDSLPNKKEILTLENG